MATSIYLECFLVKLHIFEIFAVKIKINYSVCARTRARTHPRECTHACTRAHVHAHCRDIIIALHCS